MLVKHSEPQIADVGRQPTDIVAMAAVIRARFSDRILQLSCFGVFSTPP